MPYTRYKNLGGGENKEDKENANFVTDIIDKQHKQQLITSNRLLVVDVYGTWCMPCQKIAPNFGKLAKYHNKPGHCLLCKEDVDKHITQNVNGVPTFLFYKYGKLVHKIVGADLNKVSVAINGLKN